MPLLLDSALDNSNEICSFWMNLEFARLQTAQIQDVVHQPVKFFGLGFKLDVLGHNGVQLLTYAT